MTYSLHDANGYVTDLCSGGGLEAFYDALSGTALSRLAHNGYIEVNSDTLKDIANLKIPKGSAGLTMKILKEYAPKCDHILIIHDGVGLDDGTTDKEVIWQRQ